MSNNLVNQSTKAISTNELRWIGPVLDVVSSGPMDLFFVWAFRWQKSIQKCKPPSFFHTNTTALHRALWLGLMAPDSNISFKLFLTSSTISAGNLSKPFFKRGIISHFYYMLCGSEYNLTLPDPMWTHHGIWPGAGKQHQPALGSTSPGCLSPIHQIICHVFA